MENTNKLTATYSSNHHKTVEVVGADAFYKAIVDAEYDASKHNQPCVVIEYDQHHNFIRSETVQPNLDLRRCIHYINNYEQAYPTAA